MSIIDPDEFELRYAELSDDEQRVLSEMLRRIEMGRDQYGPLDVAKDKRSWAKEGMAEFFDMFFYFCAQTIKDEEEGKDELHTRGPYR